VNEQWHYIVGGKQAGPVSGSELRRLAATGRLSPHDLVWKAGLPNWVPAREAWETIAPPGTGAPHSPVIRNEYVSYAGFWKRAVAAIVDSVVCGIGGLVVGFALGIVLVLGGTDEPDVLEGIGRILGFVLGWLYYAGMESSSGQATLGKMAVGIKVTDLDGYPIGFLQATGRYFAKFLSAILLGVGFLMGAFTERRQGLHDMMAGCLVVNR
jgi:uncharacterized RDD family membrane protein YckC